jgi:dihydroorotate dehydrogenase
MFFCIFCNGPSRSLWQALAVTGIAGFGTAIGVHYPIGYTSFTHLAPAYLGATMFLAGMAMTYRGMCR